MDIDSIVARVTAEVQKRFAQTGAPGPRAADLAGVIEHSLLNPDTAADTIRKGCEDAKKYGFANVCVSPYYVSMATELLRGSKVGICAPVGFPHGAASTKAKCAEIREAIMNGATELDRIDDDRGDQVGQIMTMSKRIFYEMVSVAGRQGEGKGHIRAGPAQSDEEKAKALKIAVDCGADYIKISNALTGKKACVEDVKFVRSVVGGQGRHQDRRRHQGRGYRKGAYGGRSSSALDAARP